MVDPLIVTGVFMLGASAGALLTHVRHRSQLNRCEELLEGIYDTCADTGTGEARGARRGPTSQVRVQPILVAENRGHLNRHRSKSSVPRTSGITGWRDTDGDQRLAQ